MGVNLSYVVSVRRDTPITVEELRTLLAGKPEYTMSEISGAVDDESLELRWNSDSSAEEAVFVLSGGKIDSFTPSDETLAQLQVLANLLKAEVFGEEGENLTQVTVAANASGGCGPFIWSAVGIAAFVFIYWIWN
ncbi:hypothetical protein MJD09_15130 [bacterium]|nr:hypothetical protein [bacterium]